VRITGAANQLASLEQALRDLPAVDEARVAAVRAALEQGRYTILPQHIADQLMQLEQSLHKLATGGTGAAGDGAGTGEPE
jgi:negative regulator of flagellin synthesis FlgM